MGKFEIFSTNGRSILGILVSISISPDSIPSGISLSMIEMTKNFAMNEQSGEMMKEEMMDSGEMMKEEMMDSNHQLVQIDPSTKMMENGEADISDTAFVSMPSGSGTPACAQTNKCFIPFNAEIISGGTVTWSNDDVAVHTVTSGIVSEGPDDIFDSGIISPGSTFEHTFEDSGTYDYFCIVHPWMIGTVQVQ